MSITAVYNARLLDREGRWIVRVADGRITAVEAFGPDRVGAELQSRVAAGTGIDAAGGLLTPALVDAHLHLDLAYSGELVPANRSGTLLEAIALWTEAKKTLSAENVRARALRAIGDEVEGGTGFIRSHVDVAATAGMRLAEGVLAARAATKALCTIQLVAFPQDGLLRDRPARALMEEALKAGVDLVGGIPHIERTPAAGLEHLKLVFDVAEKHGRDIDVHIDETDDPGSRYTEHLAALTIERGWQGRVTASHVCALSSYDDVHASRVIGLLREAQVNVVTNPGVNLHLQGRFDRYPKRRGLTRVRELRAWGVPCAAGQDCIRDPFYPLGNGRMLDQAFLLMHADHMSSSEQIREAFDMVCGGAAEVVGRALRTVEPAAPADLALFMAEDAQELVRLRPRPVHVLHRGVIVS